MGEVEIIEARVRKIIDNGVEIYEPYHNMQKRLGLYEHLYLGDVMDVLPTLKEKHNVIIASHLIEHLEKEQGLMLMDMIEERI